mmetsp:Transcript_17260/g.24739  ORF Transcript_17260/g.24739 Transcript_17260/m.24739 type:complete len:250 (-) Transcript_17260:1214-1963(-)
MKAFFGDDSDEETGRIKRPEDDADDDDERPSSKRAKLGPGEGDEEDDLDAYMAQINQQAKENASKRRVEPTPFEKEEDDDPVTSYMAFREEKAVEFATTGKDVEAEDSGASESNATDSGAEEEGGAPKKKSIASVEALDHAGIDYAAFRKEFYQAHPDIAALSPQEVHELRKELGVKVSGSGTIPAPGRTFAELNSLGRELLDAVKRHGYEIPSEIQSQAIPVVMSGRDVIGIAKTGSGKTVSTLLPIY